MGSIRSALYQKLSAGGARMGEYNGAETALDFRDTVREYAALGSGCGVFDLGWRARIIATGEDRQRWLNGMVTNNVRDLSPGQGNYNFVLNAQGRIQGDLLIYNRGEYLLLETDAAQLEKLHALLDGFIIMDDVELTAATDKVASLGVGGPAALEVLQRAGFDATGLEPLQVRDAVWRELGISVVRGLPVLGQRYEIWASPANLGTIWDALIDAGATPVGAEALELARILAGVPRYGQDIRDRDLAPETGQEHALHFTKGCYLGQEIVERIRSRGAVHRKFTGFEFPEGMPQPGIKITVGGRNSGEITSVAEFPDSGRKLGLGYIRKEAAPPGAIVDAGGVPARVSDLPFPEP